MNRAERPVVISYDGSGSADHAIEEAAKVLSGHRAIVVTVREAIAYALPDYGAAPLPAPAYTLALDRDVDDVCSRTAAKGAERARAVGFDAESTTVEAAGAIWEAVLDAAIAHDAIAIVVGSRGLGGMKSLVLGSVSTGSCDTRTCRCSSSLRRRSSRTERVRSTSQPEEPMPRMPRIDTLGAPHHERHHHRLRRIASILAAFAGAVAVLLIGFLIIGTVSPAQAAVVYGVLLILIAIWLTGIWWRWDSPDMRDPHNERERRGF